MTEPGPIDRNGGHQWLLLSQLRELGDAIEAAAPAFDPVAGAAQLRQAASSRGLIRRHDTMFPDLVITDARLEDECGPFDVEAGAARLQESARAQGLLPAEEAVLASEEQIPLTEDLARRAGWPTTATHFAVPELAAILFNIGQGEHVQRPCSSCSKMTEQVIISYSETEVLRRLNLRLVGRILDIVPAMPLIVGKPSICHCGTLNRVSVHGSLVRR